jgi:PAS domain S-box-containing protein/putative nucleotidyltransferase with HDIG domain
VFFIVINDSGKILFSSPICAEEYGLAVNEKIEWIEKDEKIFVKLKGKASRALNADEVMVRAIFEQTWHGASAKMLLLDESLYRNKLLGESTSSQKNSLIGDFLPWVSFRCQFDPALNLVEIGDDPEELTGYSAADLLSQTPKAFRNHIPEQERKEIWQEIQSRYAENKPYQVVYSFQSAGSEIRWFQEQGHVKKSRDGSNTYIKGWIIDLTDRKRASEALRESEVQYRRLVEASPDSVLMLDKDSHILLANSQFCQLIGVSSPDSVLGKSIFDFLDAEFADQTFATLEEAIAKLPPNGNRMFLKLKKGPSIPVEVNFSTISFSGGGFQAYIAVARDLRQREETQKALRESEARYRAIVEENPEMVIRFNKAGVVTFANASFCRYTGLTQEQLIGQKIENRVNGPGHHLLQKMLAQFNPDMDTMEHEFSVHTRKAGELWFRWKTIAIKDTNGNFIEYQSIGEDITAQKKSHLAELEAQNRLREVMENIKLIAVILDVNGQIVFCNTHFTDIVGWKREEALHQDWISNFIPPEFADTLKGTLFENSAHGSVPIRNENPILTRSGEQRLISWYNTALRNSRGEFEGIASIGEDITEKHLSETVRDTILKISQAANQAVDLDTLFQLIQDALKELMPVDNFFIALYDADRDILSFPFYKDAYDPQPVPDKPKHGLTEYVLRTGKSALVNPQKFDELIASGDVESIGAPSLDWIGVPLKIENRVIGVMGAQTYSPGVRYEAKEEQILSIISNQVAMAILRKRSEQDLRDSQKRNELLVSASKDAIFTVSISGKILDFNDVATEMYGYTREEFLQLTVLDLIPASTAEEHPDYIHWEIEQGGEIHDVPNVRKDGSIFPVDVSMRQAVTQDGPVLITYIRDITEQKLAAQVIIESEEKFRALAENSAAGIFIHTGGRNIYVNPMWSSITGYSILELLQKKPIDLADPTIPAEEKKILVTQLNGETIPDRFEFAILTHNDEKKVIDLNITSIRFEERNAIMGTAIDITNRKEREHELEVIVEMSEALRISIKQADILETSISKISDILKIDGSYIALVSDDPREIQMKIGTGVWKAIEGTTIAINQGLSGHIIATGQVYINHDPQNDPSIVRPDLVSMLKSVAGVPLIAAGRTIGVLVIGSKKILTENDIRLMKAMGDFTASALHRADLFEQSILQARELQQAYNSTLEGWALALELRDKETQGHSVRIANLTLKLARRMGIPEAEMEKIRRGALLHDIGKLGVPDTILLKQSTLTPTEWATMQMHPSYAFEMLSQLKDFKESIDIPYCHHEWWDGSGYPRGMEGDNIPLAARIFCIVDVWDALTSDRPYRQAWTRKEALAHIINQAGTHFDPHVVNEFIKMIVDDK